MKIISLEIVNFGKLSGFSLKLNDGVNVIGQNNGFGKTTLVSFVRTMLYGVEYRKQNSPYYYKNFQPWGSDGRFGGSMTVEHLGRQYRIERYFSVSKSGQLLNVIDLATGKNTGIDCPGEYFLGLTSTSFEQSVYLPQETVAISNNENFEQKLSGMIEGDRQDNNYDKAVERLRNYCKELRAERGRGGVINAMDEQLQQAQIRLNELERQQITQQQWKEEDKAIALRLNELNEQENKLNGQLASLRAEALSAKRNTDNSHAQQVRLANEYLRSHDIERILADKRKAERIAIMPQQSKNNGKLSKLSITGLALIVLAIIVATILAILSMYAVIAVAGVVAVLGIVLIILGKGAKADKQQLQQDHQLLQQLCTAYGVEDGNAEMLLNAINRQESQYNNCRTIVDLFGATVSQADNAGDNIALERDIATLSQQLEALRQQRDRLLRQSGDLKGRLTQASLDNNSIEIEDKIVQLKNAIQEAEYKYRVASVAKTLLDEAREQLSTSYIPRLANLSSRLLDKATGGELTSVNVDGTFNVSITENGQTHSVNEYSRGVRELTAFCFRVALSSTVFEGNVPLLIIDDAFVNLDEMRFDNACRLLQSMARQGTQVLYMTCHQRSKRVF